MRAELLGYLACPACGGNLLLVEPVVDGPEIRTANLRCTNCAASYPVQDFIPRFVPERNYAESFGFQWRRFALTQFDRYSGLSESRERFFEETGWPRNLAGEVIIEAGCGSGRFTPHAAETGGTVLSFDYSAAIDVNRKNNVRLENVHYVQADIYHLPFRRAIADKIFCFGVLQHCPSPKSAFMSLLKVGKPTCQLVIDVYRLYWRTFFHGKYYLRLLSSPIPAAKLFPVVQRYVRFCLPVLGAVRRASPQAAGKLSALLAVSDFRKRFEMNPEVLFEWCLLDTFDKLSPVHDHPQTVAAVRTWFQEARLADIEVGPGYNGIVGRGRVAAAQNAT